jgi:hypothetical protein
MNNRFGSVQILGMLVGGLVLLTCYTILPYIGGGIVIFFDYAAYGLRWLDISNPSLAWLVLGIVFGGLFGLHTALRGMGKSGLPRIAFLWTGAGFATLYVLSFLFCHTMKPSVAAPIAPAPSTTAPTAAPTGVAL